MENVFVLHLYTITLELEPMKTFTISIPKPCHEDWNKMTLNEKGAFCASCQKTVYDFSNKSDKEIVEVFEAKKEEKVCGRFLPSQLSRPVVTFETTTTTGRLVKFISALLLVFGIRLFTGVDVNAQTVKGETRYKKVGKVAIRPVEMPAQITKDTTSKIKKQSAKCEIGLKGDVRVVPMMGQPIAIEEVPHTISGDTILTIKQEKIIETKKEDPNQIINLEPVEIISIMEPTQITSTVTGGAMITVIHDPAYISEVETKSTTEEVFSERQNVDKIEMKAYPNPSKGEVVLSYDLKSAKPIQIDLFDVTGKKIKTLTQLSKQYPGKYNLSYSLENLPNGIYIAKLFSNDDESSTKIILVK